nr:unnamed protein product [Naegleria fowleri]
MQEELSSVAHPLGGFGEENDEERRVIVDFEEFESSKENIIPLKTGRRAVDLRRVFGSSSSCSSCSSQGSSSPLRGVLKERKDWISKGRSIMNDPPNVNPSISTRSTSATPTTTTTRLNSPIFMMNSLSFHPPTSFPTATESSNNNNNNNNNITMMMMIDESQLVPAVDPCEEEEEEDEHDVSTSTTLSLNNNGLTSSPSSSPICLNNTNNNNTTHTTPSNYNNSSHKTNHHGKSFFFNFNHLIKKVCFENHNMKPKLSQERKVFEKRIASTSILSNHVDPLSVWLEYIEWIEKNYPTLNKSSQYVPTLQACTKYILSSSSSSQKQQQQPHDSSSLSSSSSSSSSLLERYREDERYLKVWLKYADQCLDPIDVFTFLESKKIGLSHAELYIRWATVLEDRKDLKAADAVLEQGKNRGAQPLKSLETFHTGVKARFMKSILNRTQSGQSVSSSSLSSSSSMSLLNQSQHYNSQSGQSTSVSGGSGGENCGIGQRAPFNPLSKKPSSIRPLTAKPPTMMKPMKMKMNNPSLAQKNSPLNNFVIYDESVNHAEKLAHAASTRTLPFQIQRDHSTTPHIVPRVLPSEQESEKENHERPDKWTNYSNPQFATQDVDDLTNFLMVPPPVVNNAVSKPSCHFSIFVDDEFK